MNEVSKPVVLGGVGEKKSNGGTQYYQQDRVYSIADISNCLPANLPGGSYNYLEIKKVEKMKDKNCERLGNVYKDENGTGYAGNVWDSQFLCPTIDTCGGGEDNLTFYRQNR